MTGSDQDELWFQQKLEIQPSVGLEGIKRIRTLLNEHYSSHGKWHKKVPSSARRYQAGVIADIELGQPVIQNVDTYYLPFFSDNQLTHYDVVYGYDRSAKTLAIAEEWDPRYTFGHLPSDYHGVNPYGLHADVPRSAAYNAVHNSPNKAYVQ